MSFTSEFKQNIFDTNENNFEKKAIELFHFQYKNCFVYQKYVDYLGINVFEVKNINDIPFLPIQFFKQFKISSTQKDEEFYFQSSGTTGQERSIHYVYDLDFYNNITIQNFEYFYGSIKDYQIIALLPNYLENPHSSLISMIDFFIKKSENFNSGYYTLETIESQLKNETKKLVIGVSFALLDLVEEKKLTINNTIVMETGGMKGRRKELIRTELHEILKTKLNLTTIHSEYGMSELFSQAYSKANGIFQSPPWMKFVIRDVNDPFTYKKEGRGGINVIDLANIDSCSFIETKDLGKIYQNNTFEVLGRFDNSDLRGCNLMLNT